jgi:hypothetical protein
MPMKNTKHVAPAIKGGWSVRNAGAERATRIFPTQSEAVSYAKDMVRREKGILYLHRADGTVKEKRSYAD